MTYLQRLKELQEHYKGSFKALKARERERPRAFYSCKECLSTGELVALVAHCPVCGSRHVELARSEQKLQRLS